MDLHQRSYKIRSSRSSSARKDGARPHLGQVAVVIYPSLGRITLVFVSPYLGQMNLVLELR